MPDHDPTNRMELLLALPPEDRLQALGDEMIYGEIRAEHTDDGWRRLDPLEETDETPHDPTHPCPFCGGDGERIEGLACSPCSGTGEISRFMHMRP